jgi:hypothetical protein
MTSSSTPGAAARARSVRISWWVTATISWAPRAFSWALAARPAPIASRISTSGPGFEVFSVSGVVSPNRPTLTPPSVRKTSGSAPPNGRPVRRSSTLAESQVNADSRMRWASTPPPKSNSWLPNVARSRPIALSPTIICSPLSSVEATEGEITSPARASRVAGFSRRMRATSVASRANPPRRPSSTGSRL